VICRRVATLGLNVLDVKVGEIRGDRAESFSAAWKKFPRYLAKGVVKKFAAIVAEKERTANDRKLQSTPRRKLRRHTHSHDVRHRKCGHGAGQGS
jgi:hypothetical protein